MHLVHVCAGPAKIGKVAFETGHVSNLLYFSQDTLFGAAHDELALVG